MLMTTVGLCEDASLPALHAVTRRREALSAAPVCSLRLREFMSHSFVGQVIGRR
jgi:hypothetical protein